MISTKFLVFLNGQPVARYSSISFAYAKKRKIEKTWWFNSEEDVVEIYDAKNGTFVWN